MFNLVDAVAGDGAEAAIIPGELAELGLAFPGNGSKTSLVCASKPGMKRIMNLNDLPTPEWTINGQDVTHFPRVIVKAMYEHASIGLVLSRFSSGFFRAMFAMKEIENGNEIYRRVSS